MNKFDEGKIYKITDSEDYIGSTCVSLNKRMERHRGHYRAYLQGTSRYMTSLFLFDTYVLENCRIELIKEFACNNREDLLSQEKPFTVTHLLVSTNKSPSRT